MFTQSEKDVIKLANVIVGELSSEDLELVANLS